MMGGFLVVLDSLMNSTLKAFWDGWRVEGEALCSRVALVP